jgi:ornithine carbamoyltransferase
MKGRHFLDIHQLASSDLTGILDDAVRMKADLKSGKGHGGPLAGRTLAMVFEKPSTRTRFSFEVGMQQLGGHSVVVSGRDMQLGRGETIADTARVLSRYVDAIMIRTFDERLLQGLAEFATVPIINGLTDQSHPCQIMADVMTFQEHRGPIRGKSVAWIGDANNVCRSWMHAAVRFGFQLRIAAPEELQFTRDEMRWAVAQSGDVVQSDDPFDAVDGADAVVTDCWVSMGDKDSVHRHNLLRRYQVDDRLMAAAAPNAIFMHCLPAHRGEEVTDAIIDGPRSVVFDEAENRLHAQKAILTWCLGSRA